MTDHAWPPTLYDRAGGRDALRRLIDTVDDCVENDELLAPLFPGGVSEEHRDNVTVDAPVPRWGWGVAPPWRP